MSKSHNTQSCGSFDHEIGRRAFLGGLTACGVAGLSGVNPVHALSEPEFTKVLKAKDRRVILLWLAGGASQFETFDPKPGRPTGGPFGEIPTNITGVKISELMPKMAKRMDTTCLIRSLSTGNADHVSGSQLMMRGRRDEPNLAYPDFGAMVARELAQKESQVPDYVSLFSATEGRRFSRLSQGFLPGRYAPMRLEESMKPPNLEKLDKISQGDHERRSQLQSLLNQRFLSSRKTSVAESHAAAFARVNGLMSSQKLFDISDEPQYIKDMYGPTLFGQQALMARRMVEAGVPFVRVARAWWDSHAQNFETHLELVPELDRVMSALLDDLKARGMLDNTLVITLGEFGRTPRINPGMGRDHFARAWSASLSGAGVVGGSVYGETDENGEHVKKNPVNAGQFVATVLEAAGIDSSKEYHVGARPVPLVDPGIEPVRDVLS